MDTRFKEVYSTDELYNIIGRFKTKKELREFNPTIRRVAQRRGIWNDATKNYSPIGSLSNRLVYAYVFADNSVYVGLTYNESVRDRQHLDGKCVSAVYDRIKETGIIPEKLIISNGYIDYIDAAILENTTINDYRNKGWTILNKYPGGGLGGGKHRISKYTTESIEAEALKYKSTEDFKQNSNGYYQAARRKGVDFYKTVTKHMPRRIQKYNEHQV